MLNRHIHRRGFCCSEETCFFGGFLPRFYTAEPPTACSCCAHGSSECEAFTSRFFMTQHLTTDTVGFIHQGHAKVGLKCDGSPPAETLYLLHPLTLVLPLLLLLPLLFPLMFISLHLHLHLLPHPLSLLQSLGRRAVTVMHGSV